MSYQNLNDSSEVANKFIIKQRVIKEKEYSGSFRIPQETLKKHVNPSEMFELRQQQQSMQQSINQNNYKFNSTNKVNYNNHSDEEFNL